MRVLVTGSHGFAGTHLRAALRPVDVSVTGTGPDPSVPGEGEGYLVADLRDLAAVRALVEEARPDLVFHLAAVTGYGRPGGDAGLLQDTVDTNVVGTCHLMSALAERGRAVRVVHVGSSAQYGVVPRDCDPVDEDAPQFPLGVYGWSKTASEAVAMTYHGREGVEVVAIRPFNQTGPGEPPQLVVASFARQIAAAEAGKEQVLRVGNLSSVRDFTDIRDTAEGLVALAQRGRAGKVYNLCSGVGVSIEDVLAMLLDKSRVSIEVRADADRSRPGELSRQVGSAERARRDVDWVPTIDLSTSLTDVLDEWRARTEEPARGRAP